MKAASRLLFCLLLLLLPVTLRAQAPPAPPQGSPAAAPSQAEDEATLHATLDAQAAAWSRGDIPAFMQNYEDSPDTTFVGKAVRKGYQPILERYQLNYSTPEQMGTLVFSDVDVRLLPSGCGHTEIALVTGRYHLFRTIHGAITKDDGIFSLVWRKGPHGWKIILDHTS